jgi:hypothetical protein
MNRKEERERIIEDIIKGIQDGIFILGSKSSIGYGIFFRFLKGTDAQMSAVAAHFEEYKLVDNCWVGNDADRPYKLCNLWVGSSEDGLIIFNALKERGFHNV